MTGVAPGELAGHPFLRGMPPALLAPLASVSTPVTMPEGQQAFEEGTAADSFWLLLRRAMAAASRRLQATRFRLLDLYAAAQDGDAQ
jgi:hypothetical protein